MTFDINAILVVAGILLLFIGVVGRKLNLQIKDFKLITETPLNFVQRVIFIVIGLFLITIPFIPFQDLIKLNLPQPTKITETSIPPIDSTFLKETLISPTATTLFSTPFTKLTQASTQEIFTIHTVPANEKWYRTDIYVNIGQKLEITSSGKWTNLEGQFDLFDANGRELKIENAIMPNVNVGALIGRIGLSSEPFFIGAIVKLTSADEGDLFLSMNDSFFTDNAGEMVVEVWLP